MRNSVILVDQVRAELEADLDPYTAVVEAAVKRTRPVLVREEVGRRQSLHGEFISECAKLFLHAFQHSLENPETFVPVYSLINRIRLCASPQVLTEAELLLGRMTEQYFSSNLSLEELRALARSGEADPLKAFGIACRAELESVRARV